MRCRTRLRAAGSGPAVGDISIMTPDSDLLRPSLSPGRETPAAIYSVRATFLTSFFGGPVGSALIFLINAHRLRRLAREWPIGLLAVAVMIALRWSMSRHFLGGLEPVLGRLTGLAFFAIGYALHAPYHRSQTFLDVPTPNGLWVGILCVLVGQIALLVLMTGS
jgi:hypothetical protein